MGPLRCCAIGLVRRFPRERTDRAGLVVGLVLVAAFAVAYLLLAAELDHPLSAFVIPPLATAGLSGWRQTAIVTVAAATTAGIVEQFTTDPFDGGTVASRVVLILLAGGFGAATAAIRRRQEVELEDASATLAVASALQVGLLPALHPINGFRVGLRYRSGEARLLVGGDFVDLVPLDEDRLAFIVGDVCGHGPSAASLGSSLRSGWRTLVGTSPADPVAWLRALDRVFLRPLGVAGGHVTACSGVVDRSARQVTLVSAGHPWPVLVGREPRLVEVHAGQPMGLVEGAPSSWATTTVDLGDDRLLVYTDGLIEARVTSGSRMRRGHEGLLLHLRTDLTDDPEALLDGIIDAMGTDGTGQYEDDVAVLLIGVQRLGAEVSAGAS